jgi:hypothetical protein
LKKKRTRRRKLKVEQDHKTRRKTARRRTGLGEDNLKKSRKRRR